MPPRSLLDRPAPPRGPWASRIITTLCELKADGWDFEDAWHQALEEHPPRGRDLGEQVPSLMDEELSHVEFLWRECGDAWHGRRPVLRHLVIPEPERMNVHRTRLA